MTSEIKKKGCRVEKELRNDKSGLKIRDNTIQKITYWLIIGDREVERKTVAVRSSNGKDLGSMTVADCVSILEQDISSRGRV